VNALTEGKVMELTCSILENMAFMMLEEAVDVDAMEPTFHTRIEYAIDQEASEVFLSATTGFLEELASGMLSAEPEDVSAGEEGLQALQELSNVIVGEIGRALGAESTPLIVGLPEVIYDIPTQKEGTECLDCVLDSMGETLRVLVHRSHLAER